MVQRTSGVHLLIEVRNACLGSLCRYRSHQRSVLGHFYPVATVCAHELERGWVGSGQGDRTRNGHILKQ